MAGDWPQRLAEVHDRRFGPGAPSDLQELARRARFLEQRGFPSEAIRRFLRWND
jgi:regulatory protein